MLPNKNHCGAPTVDDSANAFGWREWPFRIVADLSFADVWADRSILREEIDRRLRRLRSIPHSTIQMIWADFGAGKSHTLRNVEAQCLRDDSGKLTPVYTELSVGTAGLIDLYRGFASALPAELLPRLANAMSESKNRRTTSTGDDLRQALRLLASSDASGRTLAREWLQARPGAPHLKVLKAFGINSRIDTDAQVVDLVSDLVRLNHELSTKGSLVWLVDEFQRVADVPARRRVDFAKGLVSLFNSCPTGLHVVLSLSVAQQATAVSLVPPDLRSRATTFPMLMLPQLGHQDCLDFSRGLFKVFRLSPRDEPDFPFSPHALEFLVSNLEAHTSGFITPRVLMQRLEAVLFEVYDSSCPIQLPLDEAAVHTAIDALAARDLSD